MKHLISISCCIVFCFSVLFSSCRTWKDEEGNCLEKYSEWPRNSTTTKEISWNSCYYENGKLKEWSFSFEETGCFHHVNYYSKTREYYSNGRIEKEVRSRGKKELTKEYFTTGGMHIKTKSRPLKKGIESIIDAPNDTTVALACGVDHLRQILIDSITGKRIKIISRDTILKIRAKF